jgi:hypothetical protein
MAIWVSIMAIRVSIMAIRVSIMAIRVSIMAIRVSIMAIRPSRSTAQVLGSLTSLTRLSLAHNMLGDEAAATLMGMLQVRCCKSALRSAAPRPASECYAMLGACLLGPHTWSSHASPA